MSCAYLFRKVFHSFILSLCPPERLSVADGEAAVRQLAQTLQACVELKDPVQQVKLVKKVGLVLRYSRTTVFPTDGNEPFSLHIVPGRVPAEVCERGAARWRSPPPGLLSAHPGAALCLPDTQEPPQSSHRQVNLSLSILYL